jgi:hypothetical protein
VDVGEKVDAREYMKQLRTTPVDGVISDAVMALLSVAQVKLGRRDARLLIDLSAVMLDHVRSFLPAEITREFDRRLGALRLGQVSAENEASRKKEVEANDIDKIPAPPRAPEGSGG